MSLQEITVLRLRKSLFEIKKSTGVSYQRAKEEKREGEEIEG